LWKRIASRLVLQGRTIFVSARLVRRENVSEWKGG
jgi:hypothetical protein